MKTNTVLRTFGVLALLLAVALAPAWAGTPTKPYFSTASATQTNTTKTFSMTSPAVVVISNDGANDVAINWNAAAVWGGSTSVVVKAYKARTFYFAPGRGPASVGIICNTGLTATVRVEAYGSDGQANGVIALDSGNASNTVTGAFTVDNITANTNVTDSGLTASRLVVSDGSKVLASNGALTTNTLPKAASSGASLSDTTISDDGTKITATEPVVLNAGIQGNYSTKALTSGAGAVAILVVAVPSGSQAGGKLDYCFEATDSTDYQARCGVIPWAAVNKAGTITCTVGTVTTATEVVAVSTGTLTAAWSCADGGSNNLQLKATDTTSLTATTNRVRYRAYGQANALLTMTAQ